jgi:hypothetical protein
VTPTASIEDRVQALASEHRPWNFCRIYPSSRLLHDPEINQERAKELFEEFEQEFNVDLTALRSEWSLYFEHPRKKGVAESVENWVLYFIALVVGRIVFAGLAALVRNDWIAILALFALAIPLGLQWRKQKLLRFQAITVQDLVDSAKSGRWVVSSDSPMCQA